MVSRRRGSGAAVLAAGALIALLIPGRAGRSIAPALAPEPVPIAA